jgi:hypothetical protein
MNYETAWEFRTKRFRVALEIEPEDMDPADSFQFQDDIDAVRNGAVEWFYARVAVYLDGERIAWDGLGGCAYESVRDFYTSHRIHKEGNYFTDMVRQAIDEARKVLCNRPIVRCHR